jgi:hypothetical protein
MSDMIEKVARAIVTTNLWGKEPVVNDGSASALWLIKEVDRCWPDYVGHARAALTLLTKPENISDSVVCAAEQSRQDYWGGVYIASVYREREAMRKAIAAGITAALQDNTEEKKTS